MYQAWNVHRQERDNNMCIIFSKIAFHTHSYPVHWPSGERERKGQAKRRLVNPDRRPLCTSTMFRLARSLMVVVVVVAVVVVVIMAAAVSLKEGWMAELDYTTITTTTTTTAIQSLSQPASSLLLG